MKNSEICKEAKNILLTRGWHQGSSHKDGKFCLVGALGIAGMSVKDSRILTKLQLITSSSLLSDWNDAPSRTLAEVIDLLDKAISEFIMAEV